MSTAVINGFTTTFHLRYHALKFAIIIFCNSFKILNFGIIAPKRA